MRGLDMYETFVTPAAMRTLGALGKTENEDAAAALAIQMMGYRGDEADLPLAASHRARQWARGDLSDIVREWASAYVGRERASMLAGDRSVGRMLSTISEPRR